MVKSDIHLSYMEIVVTTACTLKCRDCANLISFYNRPYQVDFENIVQSMEKLLTVVEKIDSVGVLGGEPFLYPYLEVLINYLCRKKKIDRVRIITNGTVVSNDISLIKKLQNDKVYIQINDYSELSKSRAKEVYSTMKANNVKILYVDRRQEKWRYYGPTDIKMKSESALENQFKLCDMKCHSLLKGKLFFCPRSAHGNDLGIIKEKTYIDLLDESISMDELKNTLHTFLYGLNYVEACKMCNAGTKEFQEIDAAIQLNIG